MLDEADIGARAPRIGGEHVVEARGLGEQARAEGAGGGTAEDRRDRPRGDLARRDDAAVRFHDVERHARAELGVETRLDGANVIGHARLHERIHDRRHRTLVLAVLGQDLGGYRHVCPGMLALEDGAHALLVLGIRVGVDEAHPDGVDAVIPEPAGHFSGGQLVERAQHLTAKI